MCRMSNWKINNDDLQIKEKCFICNNNNNEILSNVNYENLQILQTTICNDCGLVWRSKVPKFTWFLSAWNERNKTGESNDILGMSKMVEIRRKIRYRAIANNLKKVTKGMTHLDIGTGPGRGLKEFIDLGFDCIGLEPDISRAEVGQKEGLPVLNLTLEEFIENNQNKKFDVVTVVQALEHMQNPQEFINQCKKVLKSNGILYIEVPNAKNFIRWQDSLYMEHLYNFSFNHLAYMGGVSNMLPKYISFPKTVPFGPKHLAVMFINSAKQNFNVNIKSNNLIYDIKKKHMLGLDNRFTFPKEFNIQKFDDVCYVSKNIYFKQVKDNIFEQLLKKPNRYINAIKHRIELYQRQGLSGFKDKLFGNLFYKYPNIFNDKDFISPKLTEITKDYIEKEKWIYDNK